MPAAIADSPLARHGRQRRGAGLTVCQLSVTLSARLTPPLTPRAQDFVRRRRWYRKCQLTTTGPWERVNNVKLRDLSMLVSGSRPGFVQPV